MKILGFKYGIDTTTISTRIGTLSSEGTERLHAGVDVDGAVFSVPVSDAMLAVLKEHVIQETDKAIRLFLTMQNP